jgi:hypothetical protein
MSREELKVELLRAVGQPLGPAGEHHMSSIADQTARAVHAVLQVSLDPSAGEPEVAGGPIIFGRAR